MGNDKGGGGTVSDPVSEAPNNLEQLSTVSDGEKKGTPLPQACSATVQCAKANREHLGLPGGRRPRRACAHQGCACLSMGANSEAHPPISGTRKCPARTRWGDGEVIGDSPAHRPTSFDKGKGWKNFSSALLVPVQNDSKRPSPMWGWSLCAGGGGGEGCISTAVHWRRRLPSPIDPPPPPPAIPMFEADSQKCASAPLVPEGFKLTNFRPAFGGDHRGTLGGGGSQPDPPPLPPPSNTSLGGGGVNALPPRPGTSQHPSPTPTLPWGRPKH